MIPNIRHRMRNFTPPWLQRFHGWRYLYAHALIADATVEACLQGMYARLPGVGTPTALPRIARDRKIRRGYAETDQSFAERLRPWRSEHKTKGNPYTLMREVRGYLSPLTPRMRVVNSNGDWYTLNVDGSTEHARTAWNWDGSTSAWARAWLIIYSTGAQAPWVRDGTWGDGELWNGDVILGNTETTWGSTATPEQVRAIRDLVREWKSAMALFHSVIISFDDDAFEPLDGATAPNPDGDWQYWGNRDDRAIYWDGAA